MLPVLLVARDKKTVAKYLATNYPKGDCLFFELAPEGTKYLLSQIKEVVRQTFIFNPKRRIYFFPDFHVSTIEAQNAFLKALEETPGNILYILTTDSPSKLLPTVVNLSKKAVFKIEPKVQNQLENLLTKKNLDLIGLNSFTVKDKEEAVELLEQTVLFFRDRLTTDGKSTVVLKEVIRQKSLVQNNNLTPQLTIDHVLIFIAKIYNMKA